MKRFLIPFLLLGIAAWAFAAYIAYFLPAKIGGKIVLSNLIYLLLAALVGLTVSISLIFYSVSSIFVPKTRIVDQTSPLRSLFRRSLRRGFLAAATVVGLIILNVFEILNLVNATLIIGIAALIEIYFSSR